MKNKFLISFLILLSLTTNTYSFAKDNMPLATKYYNDGIDLYKENDVNGSIELFKKAIELKPDFYEANYNLAQILMSIDKNEEAIAPLEKLIELNPNDSENLYNIGKIQYKRGYLTNSKKYLDKIPEDAPQYNSAKLLIAKIEKRQKELKIETAIKEHKVNTDEQGKLLGVELGEIAAPSGTVTDSKGSIYIASFSENAIYKISTLGIKSVLSKSGLIKGPLGLAIDSKDNIYIANYSANNILKITPQSNVSILADISKPYCIFYDKEHNRLYVTEQNTNKLMKFDLSD